MVASLGEKARQELHKDAACFFERILEPSSNKTAAVLPLMSHLINHPSEMNKILFTNPSTQAGYDTRSIFKRSLTGLNSEFSFSYTNCLPKAEEPSLPYYLPIAGGRIIGFIPFPRVLVLCEMQSVSSRIWTRVTVFISYDDNHYTMGTSIIDEQDMLGTAREVRKNSQVLPGQQKLTYISSVQTLDTL